MASLLPLAWTLPPALRAGTAVRRIHGSEVLGSGWTGTVDYVESTKGTSPAAWEWSYGPVSTIKIEPTWSAISLDLLSVVCSDGKPQRVVVRSPDATGSRMLVLRGGFQWYAIGLRWVRGGHELTLAYRCVGWPAHPISGVSTVPLAVAFAGAIVQHSG